MNKFYCVLFIFMFGACAGAYAQQQFTYTQFIDNLTAINPAWSTTQEGGALNVLSRKQWVGIEGAPATTMANGYLPIPDKDATVGFTVLSDKVAIENLTEVNLFYAKAIRLSDNAYLSVAINGGFSNYNASYSMLDVNDPALVNADIRDHKVNIGASVMFYVPASVNGLPGSFFAGLSLPRATYRTLGQGSVKTTLYQKNFYFFNMGYNYKIQDDLEWDNATVVAYTANVPIQADIASKLWFGNAFGIGLDYRISNEMAILSSYKSGGFNVGYSYQFGVGSTRITGLGLNRVTHEITLGFRFGSSGSTSMEKIPFKGNGN